MSRRATDPLPSPELLAEDVKQVSTRGVGHPYWGSITTPVLDAVAREIVPDPTLTSFALSGAAVEMAIEGLGSHDYARAVRVLFRLGDAQHLPLLQDRKTRATALLGRKVDEAERMRMCRAIAYVLVDLVTRRRKHDSYRASYDISTPPNRTAVPDRNRWDLTPENLAHRALSLHWSGLGPWLIASPDSGLDPSTYDPDMEAAFLAADFVFFANYLALLHLCQELSSNKWHSFADKLPDTTVKDIRTLAEGIRECGPDIAMEHGTLRTWAEDYTYEATYPRDVPRKVDNTWAVTWLRWLQRNLPERIYELDCVYPAAWGSATVQMAEPRGVEVLIAKSGALEQLVRSHSSYETALVSEVRRITLRRIYAFLAVDESVLMSNGVSVREAIDEWLARKQAELAQSGLVWYKSR